jgi:hypothetical protein
MKPAEAAPIKAAVLDRTIRRFGWDAVMKNPSYLKIDVTFNGYQALAHAL